jgi:hypothetical protein
MSEIASYKAVGDCQVLDNTPWSDTSRVSLQVEFSKNCWAKELPSPRTTQHGGFQSVHERILNGLGVLPVLGQ